MSVPSISALTEGISLSAVDHGAHEETHEAQLHAVPLLEGVLVTFAQRHHARHVDVVERRQHGGGVLGLLQTARDGLAQAGHLHPFLALVDRAGARRSGGRSRSVGAGFQGGERVALGHAAVLAAAGNRARIQLVLGDDPLGRGRQHRFGGGLGDRRGRRFRLGLGLGSRRGFGLGRRGLRGRSRRAVADLAQQGARLDRGAFLGGDLGQHAVRGGGDFQAHLVGFELDQDSSLRDRIAGLLRPARAPWLR